MAEKEWEVNHRHATECQTELENKMTQLKELEQKLEEVIVTMQSSIFLCNTAR